MEKHEAASPTLTLTLKQELAGSGMSPITARCRLWSYPLRCSPRWKITCTVCRKTLRNRGINGLSPSPSRHPPFLFFPEFEHRCRGNHNIYVWVPLMSSGFSKLFRTCMQWGQYSMFANPLYFCWIERIWRRAYRMLTEAAEAAEGLSLRDMGAIRHSVTIHNTSR